MAFSLKKMTELLSNVTFWRGLIALLSFVIIWEILSKYFPMLTEHLGMMEESAGKQKLVPVTVPWIGKVPPPTEVVAAWGEVFFLPGYWESWYMSTGRVSVYSCIPKQPVSVPHC